MKVQRFIALLLVFSLSIPLFGCDEIPDGKVAVYLMTEYEDTGHNDHKYYEFDSNGNLTEEISYQKDKISYHRKMEYDELGNCICVIVFKDGNEIGRAPRIYEYDENGRVVNGVYYYTSGKIWKETSYQYDDAGNLIREATILEGGPHTLIYNYEYDSHGRQIKKIREEDLSDPYLRIESIYSGDLLIEEVYYDKDDKVKNRRTYKYDSKNNLIEDVYYDGGQPANQYTYEYDQNGNKVKYEFNTSKGTHILEIYEYDRKGHLTKEYHYDQHNLTATYEITCNSDGIVTKEVITSASTGNTYTRTYSYQRLIMTKEEALQLKEKYMYDTVTMYIVE